MIGRSVFRVIAGVGLMLLISAAPPPQAEDFVREGNAAYLRNEFEEAVRLFTQAEERGTDPGLIAFNKATSLYRLERFDEAEVHFRRCLDDDSISPQRRTRALYNLGNSLVKQGGSEEQLFFRLKAAVLCYDMCLESIAEAPDLHEDAIKNLELAKLLWSKARAESRRQKPPTPNEGPERDPAQPPPSKKEPDPKKNDTQDPSEGKGKDNGTKKEKVEPIKVDPKEKVDPKKTDHPPPPGPGQLDVIRHPGEVQQLSAEKTRAYLLEAAERLQAERRRIREKASEGDPNKLPQNDW